ncbi:hypothetical protein H4582DRAFT_13411 [Lactarius indigo]|nr:hypothetical protein H4582DRAFT_13411 [Lactarius indigo]
MRSTIRSRYIAEGFRMVCGKVSSLALLTPRRLWIKMRLNGHSQPSMKTRRLRTLPNAYQGFSTPVLSRIRPRQSFPWCPTSQRPNPSLDPVSATSSRRAYQGPHLSPKKSAGDVCGCLKSLWYYGKAYNQPENPDPLPSYVRVVFANPEMTRRFQAEEDPAVRVIGRCFGALVPKKLSEDLNSHNTPGVRFSEGVLACLSAILGTESSEVMSWLGKPGAIELANIVSLMSADADSLVGDKMPSDVLDVFKKTLNMLSQTLLDNFRADLPLPQTQIAQFYEIYSKVPNWLKDELQQISDKLATGIVMFPEPQLAHGSSWTNISHVSQQSRENTVRVGGAPDSGIGDGFVQT